MRKPKPRDRSFQPSGAGKGCADRTTDDAAYRKNFDRIKWSNKRWVTPTDKEIDDAITDCVSKGILREPVVKAAPEWDDELSSAGISPIGHASWEGYYNAVDRRGRD